MAKECAAQVPSYLSEAFVQRSLEADLGRDVQVDCLRITGATSVGDNYLSDVFRIHVRYDGRTAEAHLIAKCMPNSGHRGPMIDVLDAFGKEVDTFRQLVPEFSRLSTDGRELFGAHCYHATTDPVRIIVFQDLKALGYKMSDRTAGGLDFDHCSLLMKKIGLFHAGSMLYAARSAKDERYLRERYPFGFYNPKENFDDYPIFNVFNRGLDKFIEVAAGWEEFDQTLLAKLKALKPKYVRKLADCLLQPVPDGGMRVLNHGDLWGNNLMFRYTDGTVQDVVFVDYQLSHYTSPGLDLVYALTNCPSIEVRQKGPNELLRIYHESLCEGLTFGGYDRLPTLADVQREYERFEFLGLVCGISMLPIIMMERSEDMDISFDGMMDAENSKLILDCQYKGTRFRKCVKPILEYYDGKGLLG